MVTIPIGYPLNLERLRDRRPGRIFQIFELGFSDVLSDVRWDLNLDLFG